MKNYTFFKKPLAQTLQIYYNYNIIFVIIISERVFIVEQLQIAKLDSKRILMIVDEVERTTEYIYSAQELTDIIDYTVKKCERINKDEDYFYLLLRDELEHHQMIAFINFRGEQNRRRRLVNV